MKVMILKTNMVVEVIPVSKEKAIKFMDVATKKLYSWEELGSVKAEVKGSFASEKSIPITVNIGVSGKVSV